MMTNDEMKKVLKDYVARDNSDDAVLPAVLLSLLESVERQEKNAQKSLLESAERQEKNAQKRMFIILSVVVTTVIAVEVAVVFLIPLM